MSETLNASTSSWTYNAANQITNSGYTYDAAGNRTAGGTVNVLGYDKLNRTTDLDGISATYLGAGQGEIDTLDGDTIARALPGLAVDDGYRIIRTPSDRASGLINYGQRWYDARSPLWDSPLLAGGQWEEIGSRDTRSQPNPPMSGIGILVGPTWLSATLSAALPPSS